MTFIKTVVVGICGAILAVVLLVVVTVIVPLYFRGGLNGLAVIDSRPVLAAAVIGFALGVVWMRRRVRQQR